jgi:hypothetical protein
MSTRTTTTTGRGGGGGGRSLQQHNSDLSNFGTTGLSHDDTHVAMVRRPLHEHHSLHLRSEIMEHNITLGLNVLKYLEQTCEMSPNRASEFVRPVLSNETIKIQTCRGMEGPTFSPLKYFALKQYGQHAFRKHITPYKIRKRKNNIGDKRVHRHVQKQAR